MASMQITHSHAKAVSPLEVFLNRKPQVYAYIYRYVQDPMEADDLYQEMTIKVIQKVADSRYREEGKVVQWIMRLVRNFLIDHYRRRQVRKQGRLEDFHLQRRTSSVPSPEVERIREERIRAIEMALESLPVEQAEVIRLRFYERKKFREIAEITQTNINTVLGRYRYGLSKMRKFLDDSLWAMAAVA